MMRTVSQHRNITLREVAAELVQTSTGPQPASAGPPGRLGRQGHRARVGKRGNGRARPVVGCGRTLQPRSNRDPRCYGGVGWKSVSRPEVLRKDFVALNCCPYVVCVAGLAFARP